MKKFIYLLSLLSLTLTLNSCSADIIVNSFPKEINDITIYAPNFITERENTRTAINIDINGAEFSWSSNDTIGIFPNEGRQIDFPMASGAGTNTAIFTGGGWALKTSSTYAAYYPLQGEFHLNKKKIPLSYIRQCQVGNNSTFHLGAYDYMGAVTTTPENGNVNFHFKHLGALVRLNIPIKETCSLNSVVLYSEQEDFITQASLDLTSTLLNTTPIEKSKRYEILLKELTISEDTGMATIYFMLSPIDLSEKRIVILAYSEQKVYHYEFSGKNFKEGTAYSITATPSINDNAMILVTSANFSNNFTAYLPKLSGSDITIDWGDGKIENYASISEISYTHQYSTNVPTDFDIKITGDIKGLNSYDIKRYTLTGIKQWGTSKLKNINNAFFKQPLKYIANDKFGALQDVTSFDFTFEGCSALTVIPEGLFDYCQNVTSFDFTFGGCSALTVIPEGLFDKCQKVTSFYSTFKNCSTLTEIPEGLFDKCQNVTNFSWTFYKCSNLVSIPEGLFDYCQKVTEFWCTFYECSTLTEIPEGLFDKCQNVTNFFSTFCDCKSLKYIPTNLFDNNRKVTEFNNTFYNCTNLTGESPYTEINGVKYHLYEREMNADQFASPEGSDCFNGCLNLTDYNDIPHSWKY